LVLSSKERGRKMAKKEIKKYKCCNVIRSRPGNCPKCGKFMKRIR
jgi:hypothetical protein